MNEHCVLHVSDAMIYQELHTEDGSYRVADSRKSGFYGNMRNQSSSGEALEQLLTLSYRINNMITMDDDNGTTTGDRFPVRLDGLVCNP